MNNILLCEKSLSDFVNELASANPTPGGGSAAAMAGAMAAGLCLMVIEARIKSNRKIDDEDKKILMEFYEKATYAKNNLTELIDRDAESYKNVMVSLKLPRESEDDKNKWFWVKDEAYKDAVIVPLAVFRDSCRLESVSGMLLDWCGVGIISKSYISDIKTAGFLARAARDSALAVIKINLPEIADAKHFIELVKNEIGETILF